jgi:hypothetical protein
MSRKNDLAPLTSGWGEVILGGGLSVVLGVVLGALAVVLMPTVTAEELPKELAVGANYFIEGSRGTNQGMQAAAKRKSLSGGATGFFSITEDELNALVVSAEPRAVPAAVSKNFLTAGTLNFLIHGGDLYVGIPGTMSALGAQWTCVVQAEGSFARKDHAFVSEPETVLVGSCPVQWLPYASTYVTRKFLSSQTLTEDIAAVWPKLASFTVDGGSLKLTMP